MADFTIPWSSVSGEHRLPTLDEMQGGFPCGELDISLFNGLFRQIWAELNSIRIAGGIVGSQGDDTITLQAIEALIAASTGGGTATDYILMSQARSRLPIFPDVQTADGSFGVTSPSNGTIRVPAGVSFLHRGVYLVNSAQTDLATVGSKTYHVRWRSTTGFGIFALDDPSYNPGSLSEKDKAFDSTFDDMLIARVTTTSGNVPTITNLLNKTRLAYNNEKRSSLPDTLTWTTLSGSAVPLNWARTPQLFFTALTEFRSENSGPDGEQMPSGRGIIRATGARLVNESRYGADAIQYYYEDTQQGTSAGNGLFAVTVNAIAV